ncbi:unnamed protein product, partial [Meganyctiphanes norvegica]
RKGPRGIPAGGIIITVDGRNFDVIKEPKMYVEYKGKKYPSTCEAKNATRMECQTPKINSTKDFSEEIRLTYGFIMDEVKGVMNLNERDGFDSFLLYPNPYYHNFENEDKIKQLKSDYLTINGKNLDHASQEGDVEVRIGGEFCNVTSLSQNQLTCKLPKEQPAPMNNENSFPEVVVIVGGNLLFEIGYLEYY